MSGSVIELSARQRPDGSQWQPSYPAFHSLLLGQLRFLGVLTSDGPTLRAERIDGRLVGEAPVTGLVITHIKGRRHGDEDVLCIATGGVPRIEIGELTIVQLAILMSEFGIAMADDRPPCFETTSAWHRLCAWTRENPGRAFDFARADRNLPGWHSRIIGTGRA